MYDSTRLESFNNPKGSHCMSEYLAYSRVLEFLESVEFLDTLELKNPQNPYFYCTSCRQYICFVVGKIGLKNYVIPRIK